MTWSVSVQDEKVSRSNVPVTVVALEPEAIAAEKDVLLHVIEPAAPRFSTAGSDVVFEIVEAVNATGPGSRRRTVVADADAEPRASRPSAATAANMANFRIDINPPS
jgi:hypothetical protein